MAFLFMMFVSFANAKDTNNEYRQAAGKTSLNAEQCGLKAEKAYLNMGLENISKNFTLKNWEKIEKPSKDTPRVISASTEDSEYSIFCRIFETDIVMFTIIGRDSVMIRDLWDNFYQN